MTVMMWKSKRIVKTRPLFFVSLSGLFFLLAVQLNGANVVAQLEDVFKDPYILMDEKYICIFEYWISKFVVYGKNDFRKIDEFGRKGEGPGEIYNSINSKVTYYNYSIYISHFPRVSTFSIKGKLKKEIKGPSDAGSFIPLGNNFEGKYLPDPIYLPFSPYSL
jgi:hypothetical protein